MKKIFVFTMMLAMALTMQAAKVGFLVVGASDSESALPWEGGDWNEGEKKNLCEISPEKAAYLWFKNTYSAASKECILISTLQASSSKVPDDIDVLWVNLDRTTTDLNWEGEKSYDAIFNANVVNALKEFVKRGGNLLLTKQAVRLVTMIGRTSDWPSVVINTGEAENLVKTASTDSVQHVNSRLYKVFDGCTFYHDNLKYPLSSSSYTFNREAVWTKNDGEASTFESTYACRLLGRDGGSYDKVGFVEFDPATISGVKFNGTVLVMGLRGYLWSNDNSNTLKANVQKLTQNMLDYLCARPSVNWNGWEVAANEYMGSSLPTPIAPSANDAHTASVSSASYTTADADVASVDASGVVKFNYIGTTTVTAEVTAQGDGQWIPKNKIPFSSGKEVTVTGGSSSATIGMILTANQSLNKLAREYTGIPNPDSTAIDWFYTTYVARGDGQFIQASAVIPAAVKTLWIHSDRKDLASDGYLTELGGGTFLDKLRTWLDQLDATNSVFVSKQATRLIGDLGRCAYPTYGASTGGDDSWDYSSCGPYTIGNNFDSPISVDHSTHAVYGLLGTDPTLMTSGTHTNRNYVLKLNDSWDGLTSYDAFNTYQTTHDCRLLGDWGNYTNKYECGGLVEFYPKGDLTCNEKSYYQRGTVIMLGLAAYQWISPTDNMKALTSQILSYLNISEMPMPDFNWIQAPYSHYPGSTQVVQIPYFMSLLSWTTSDADVVEIETDPAHSTDTDYKLLRLKAEGEATITATRSADGYGIPRHVAGSRTATKTIKVSYTVDGCDNCFYYIP